MEKDSRPAPVLAVVVPCYNEELSLPLTLPTLTGLLDKMSGDGLINPDSYILCVDDGSRDRTWRVIEEIHHATPHVKGIALTHNRGHQFALLAGLVEVADKCDIAISIDADMQDDPEAMVQMVREYHNGAEIVYGVRRSRDTDTWFKRNSARAFYKLQSKLGLETVYDHADYRLMSRRALSILCQYGEQNLFLRGIVPQIGLQTAKVKYDRAERNAGESKYPLSKMLAFSIDGITSFSAKPLRWIFYVGGILLALDVMVAVYVVIALCAGNAVSGWSSLLLSVWFLGSLLLIAIGVVGEYIAKIFKEVKGRPRFNVRDTLW